MNGVFESPYPVFLDLSARRALVVGGGAVAARKVHGLLRAHAQVTVVAPGAVAEIADHPEVRWHARPYRRGEVASYAIAVTATDDHAVNEQVAQDANAANVWVNSADDPPNCSFILPAVVDRGDLQIAVSTNGRSPAMAGWIRHQLDQQFTVVHQRALDVVARVRTEAQETFGSSEVDGWARALDGPLIALVADGDVEAAHQHVRRAVGLDPAGDVEVRS